MPTKSQRGQVLLLGLPEKIRVTIRDAGNGMTPRQVQDVFLPVNRKRRLDAEGNEASLKTENGKRFVWAERDLESSQVSALPRWSGLRRSVAVRTSLPAS